MFQKKESFPNTGRSIKRRLAMRVLVAICLFALAGYVAARNATPDLREPTEATIYSEEITKNYDFKFGPNPFAPSNATSSTGTFIPGEKFISSARCGTCHTDAHLQWRQSVH